jgi:ketosteroid isomerase-like protein
MKNIIIALILFSSCSQHGNDLSRNAAEEIVNADLAMSKLATKDGFYKALLAYAEDSVKIMREGKLPIMSKSEAEASWADKPVITVLTWKPISAEASEKGDMGYSFGYSTYQGKDTVTYTNYCTIWRRQKDGSWKFVFDGGNNIPSPF